MKVKYINMVVYLELFRCPVSFRQFKSVMKEVHLHSSFDESWFVEGLHYPALEEFCKHGSDLLKSSIVASGGEVSPLAAPHYS